MNTILIDNEHLAVTLPEGFSRIPHKELESLIGIAYSRLWGVRDTGRHMLINVTWKDSNALLAKLASERQVAKRIDKTFARCRPGSGYTSENLPERNVVGSDAGAYGFRFSYVVEGVTQEGEVWVFKRGTRCYKLCYYTRSETAAQNRPTFDDIFGSLQVR
ncbi:MAG: hypothetical protein IKG21_02085 [Atopobiaceae bacterium]|nr:hypothetical protein [Atopobiaceae bacterium]